MDSDAVKRKVIDYYDQEAGKYADIYKVSPLDQEFYPANSVRLDIIVDVLRGRKAKSLLDVGFGSGYPLARFLKLGFDAHGFDFSPKLVESAKGLLKQEGCDSSRGTEGDLEKRSTLPNRTFDAIVATGVFAHNLHEAAAFANLRGLLGSNGVALVEFRNSLMSLFSINRYFAPFFWDELLKGDLLPEPLREEARAFLSAKFTTEVQSVGQKRSIEFTYILARYHNPLTLGVLAASYGMKLDKTNITISMPHHRIQRRPTSDSSGRNR